MKMTYVTIAETTFELLDKAVNKLLSKGYELYGSPYSVVVSDECSVCQAMIKHKAPEKYAEDFPEVG